LMAAALPYGHLGLIFFMAIVLVFVLVPAFAITRGITVVFFSSAK